MRVDSFLKTEKRRDHTQVENICGVLVQTWPEQRWSVKADLEALPGVEVHAASDDGKLVVTVEDAEGQWAGATISRFNEVKDVLSVALIYHHFESEQEGEIVP